MNGMTIDGIGRCGARFRFWPTGHPTGHYGQFTDTNFIAVCYAMSITSGYAGNKSIRGKVLKRQDPP